MTFKPFSVLLLVAACSPYQDDEFNAGPIDAANFPLPYRGAGGDPNVNGYRAGAGTFTEILAFVDGGRAGYYSFPFSDKQLMLQDLPDGGTPATNVYPDKDPKTPIAYAFDPSPPNPFPSSQICTPPPNYTYDIRTDDMPLNEQDNIFTQLPFAREVPGMASTFEYIPVVAEVAVTAAGLACQSIKSEKRLKKVLGTPPKTDRLLLGRSLTHPPAYIASVKSQRAYCLMQASIPTMRTVTSCRNGVGLDNTTWLTSMARTSPTISSMIGMGSRRRCIKCHE